MIMLLDISTYIDDRGLVDLDAMLRGFGFVRKEDLLNIRIDTVALRQILNVSDKTLCKYVNEGLIELGNDRRIRLGDALAIDFRTLKRQLMTRQPFNAERRKKSS